MLLRYFLARICGRIIIFMLRLTGSSGTALPGLVALSLDPQFVAHASRGLSSVVVTGTNGKTTTAHLLTDISQAAWGKTLHNQAGSNLLRGVASALLLRDGEKYAVFECDEAAMPEIARQLQPQAVVLLNLFRDQMDRYGEIDKTARRWREAIDKLHVGCRLIVNADDPALAWLARGRENTLFFGIDDTSVGTTELTHTADSILSPETGQRLDYSHVYYSHLGEYNDPSGTFKRPSLDYAVKAIHSRGLDGSEFVLEQHKHQFKLSTTLPALYNIYNTAAAAVTAQALGVASEKIVQSVAAFRPAFGRFEQVQLKSGPKLILFLVKNPVGFDQVIDLVTNQEGPKEVVIGINDLIADGQDVSWLWDASIERLNQVETSFWTTGTRANEMALRLKYAGVRGEAVIVEPDLTQLLTQLRNEKKEIIYCLLTYTTLLAFRRLLEAEDGVKRFTTEDQ